MSTYFSNYLRCLIRVFCCFILVASTSAFAVGKPNVTLLIKSRVNEFFVTMTNSAREHAAKNPDLYTLNVRSVQWETDLTQQLEQLKEAIADKPDAIVIAPISSTAVVPLLKQAIHAGIVVINIDNKIDDQALAENNINVPFVGPSNRAGARLVGDYVGKRLHAGDEVAIIEGLSSMVNAQSRTAGYTDAMQAIGANVVAVKSGEWEIAKAQVVAADMIRQFPNLKALLCGNDSMAVGAINALRQAGKAGKVMVGGYDNNPEVQPLLKSGELLATIDQFGGQQAVYGIELALKALKEKISQDGLPPIEQTSVKLITK